MTDNEKQATYEAEFILRDMLERGGRVKMHGTVITLPVERKFGSLEHIKIYVDHVLKSYPEAGPCAVRQRRGNRFAHYESGTIAINDPEYGKPGWAMREIVVLHEVAHHLARGDGHGSKFRGAFVHLVTEFIGPEVGWLLSCGFMDNGLRVEVAA